MSPERGKLRSTIDTDWPPGKKVRLDWQFLHLDVKRRAGREASLQRWLADLEG
jgi:hypothetical protein